jgi:hypothetical protein
MLLLVAAGVWLSGVIWLVFHYFMRRQTDFGYSSHPLEHWSLALHGGFGVAALWMFGLLWATHIKAGWRRRRRRWSGGALFVFLLWLGVSGPGLYYLGPPDLRSWVASAHWIAGIAALAAFAAHWAWRPAADRAGRVQPGFET